MKERRRSDDSAFTLPLAGCVAPVCFLNLRARQLNPSPDLHDMAFGRTVSTALVPGQEGLASKTAGVAWRIALLPLIARR